MQNPLKTLFRKRPPLGEVAAVEGLSAGGRAGILGMLSPLVTPGEGLPGGYGTLRRMQQDPQVRACLSTKKFAVLSRGWEVHAASDTAEDKAVADFIRGCFNDMRGSLLDNLYDVLDALALGVSIVEINYRLLDTGPHAGMVGLASLKSKDPEDFVIETDCFLNITGLTGTAGSSFDPDKFVIYSYMPAYENPLGTSDLRAAYRPWMVKHQLLTWWAKYLEKFGMPTVMGSYDAGKGYGTDQQRELLSIVAQVHNESAVVLPNDMSLALLETQRAQGADFNELVGYLDRAIAKSILGQTLTSDSTGGGSTYALGQVHMDVLRFFLNKLQRDLEQGVVGEQIIRRLVGYNFAAGTACPSFSLGQIDSGQLAAAGTLIKDLVAGKVIGPEEPWIREYLGLPAKVTSPRHKWRPSPVKGGLELMESESGFLTERQAFLVVGFAIECTDVNDVLGLTDDVDKPMIRLLDFGRKAFPVAANGGKAVERERLEGRKHLPRIEGRVVLHVGGEEFWQARGFDA